MVLVQLQMVDYHATSSITDSPLYRLVHAPVVHMHCSWGINNRVRGAIATYFWPRALSTEHNNVSAYGAYIEILFLFYASKGPERSGLAAELLNCNYQYLPSVPTRIYATSTKGSKKI